MKAKKIISLLLAVVMLISMVPASIFAYADNEVWEPTELSSVALMRLYVDQVDESDPMYQYYPDAIKIEEYFTSNGTALLTVLSYCVIADLEVFDTLDYDTGEVNTSEYADTKYTSGSTQYWVDDDDWLGGTHHKMALEAAGIQVGRQTMTFSFQSTSLASWRQDTNEMYLNTAGFNADGLQAPAEEVLCSTLYLGLKPGKTLADVKGALRTMLAEEYRAEGTPSPALYPGSVSDKTTTLSFLVHPDVLEFSDKIENASAEQYDVTFNWKNADGDQTETVSCAKDTVPVAPDGSEADYSDDLYDYTFAGWDPELSEVTEATTYNATYTKSADKTELQALYDENSGRANEGYTDDSWNTFTQALAEADSVLQNADATKPEIASAKQALEDAIAGLVKKASYNITFEYKNENNETVTTVVSAEEGTVPVAPSVPNTIETKSTVYTFTGWAPEIAAATADTKYVAQYSEEEVKYDVTFIVNGTEYTDSYSYGAALIAPEVEDYTLDDVAYTFTGWTPELPATVTESGVYTAVFSAKTLYADYTAVNAALAKAAEVTAQADYTAKYTQASRQALADAVDAVVENLTISHQSEVDAMAEAINSAVDKLEIQSYDITFTGLKDGGGGDLILTLPYGSLPDPGSNVAQKVEIDDYDYTFTGWIPEITEVTGDATYTAQYSEEFVSADYTAYNDAVTAANEKLNNGTNWTAESVAALNSALAVDVSGLGRTKQAQVDAAKAEILEKTAALVEAATPVENCTVSFTYKVLENGEVVEKTSSYTVEKGSDITALIPAAGDLETDIYTYTFDGWDKEIAVTANEDAAYTAEYMQAEKPADLTAIDNALATVPADTEMYTDETVAALNNAVAAAEALKASKPGITRQTEVDAAAQAVTDAVNALTVKVFNVTFKYLDADCAEDEYKTVVVPVQYNAVPVAPVVPQSFAIGDYDYTFTAWPEIVSATADAEYTAQYSKEFVKADYTNVENAKEQAEAVLNGDTAPYTEESLNALRDAVAAVVEDLGRTKQSDVDKMASDILNAINALERKSVTVKFVADGKEVSTQTYKYGDTIVVPADPVKDEDVQYTYSFAGWKPDVAATATEDVTYTAEFTPHIKSYTVTFNYKDENGADKTESMDVNYGVTPEAPAVSDYSEGDYDYTFKSWDKDVVAVAGDTTYNAVYESEFVAADYTAYNDVVTLANEKLGQTDIYTDESLSNLKDVLAANAVETGKGRTYQSTIDAAEAAIREAIDALVEIGSYNITFNYETAEGTKTVTQTVKQGTTPVAPVVPNYSKGDYDYEFDGWNTVIVPAEADAVYTAEFTETFVSADYTANSEAVAAANAALADADKYTDETVKAVQDALAANVESGLGRTQQAAVDKATQAINDAVDALTVKTFTVTFNYKNASGEDVTSTVENVPYGTVPEAPAAGDYSIGDTVYKFLAWDAPVVAATANDVYTAVYDDGTYTAADYTALDKAVADAEALMSADDYDAMYTEATRTALADAVAAAKAVDRTLGVSQQQAVNDLTEAVVNAINALKKNTFTIVWNVNGTETKTVVNYGDVPVAPSVSGYDEDGYRYVFAGWDSEIKAAYADATYTATFTKSLIPDEEFVPDMAYIEKLVKIYNTMVTSGKYNKADLAKVQAFIDEIYSTEYTNQDEVDQDGKTLKSLIDACRLVSTTTTSGTSSSSGTTSAATGDDISLIVMAVIFVSALGLAIISIRRKKREDM